MLMSWLEVTLTVGIWSNNSNNNNNNNLYLKSLHISTTNISSIELFIATI